MAILFKVYKHMTVLHATLTAMAIPVQYIICTCMHLPLHEYRWGGGAPKWRKYKETFVCFYVVIYIYISM